MARADDDDRFLDAVMARVDRQERRAPIVAVALLAAILVLAGPALVVLRARLALDTIVALAVRVVRVLIGDASRNPLAWLALALAIAAIVAICRRAAATDNGARS